MADNSQPGGVGDTYATDDLATLNGAASSGVKVQRVKPAFGVDGDARDVSHDYPMPVQLVSDAATVTTVAASATSVTVIGANANRRGLILHATSGSAVAYVRLGAAAATSAAGGHTLDMVPGAYLEVPAGYTGEIRAIWASAAGALNVTELT